MTNYVRWTSEDGGRGPSVAIWGDLGKHFHAMERGCAVGFFDDFATVGIMDSAGAQGHYYTYEDTGVVIAGDTAVPDLNTQSDAHALGVLKISGNDAGNDEGNIQFGYGSLVRIDNAAGQAGKVLFETRISVQSITDNALALFVGLGSPGVATGYLVDTTGALKADSDFIGFKVNVDDGDKIDVVYQAASQTAQTVLANAATLAVNTYVNLGMVIDPTAPADKKIKFYADGVELNAYVSTTDLDAATFPEAVGLVPMILTKTPPAAEVPVRADWVGCVQYANGVM